MLITPFCNLVPQDTLDMTHGGRGRGGRRCTTARGRSHNESASCPERMKSDEESKQVSEPNISLLNFTLRVFPMFSQYDVSMLGDRLEM